MVSRPVEEKLLTVELPGVPLTTTESPEYAGVQGPHDGSQTPASQHEVKLIEYEPSDSIVTESLKSTFAEIVMCPPQQSVQAEASIVTGFMW